MGPGGCQRVLRIDCSRELVKRGASGDGDDIEESEE